MKFLFKLTILILTLVLFTATINAQTPGSSSIDGVDIGIDPVTPSPGKDVRVRIESFTTNLNGASIVWLVNGKNYARGTGMQTISVKAPSIGKTETVLAIIMTVEGREVKKLVNIKSGGVDLIWESSGFIPPFYLGKAGFAYQNRIKITAVPHLAQSNGVEIDPKSLVYKWTVNDQVVLDQSGYGKQTLVSKENLPKELNIKVDVSTKNSDQRATGIINLMPSDPSISFYEESPAYGVLYNKSLLNRISMKNPEMTIRAIPFNFNIYKNNSLTTYTWSINNLEQPDLSTNQSITLRTKGNSVGSSDVSLEVRNTQDILQGAKKTVSVNIKKKTESNITF